MTNRNRLSRAERRIVRAAERCISKNGFAWKYAPDARFVTVNQPAFRELEQAVALRRAARLTAKRGKR